MGMVRFSLSLLMTLAGAMLLCGPLASVAAAERLKVATSFTVIADIARHVAGEHADVYSITKPGAEIHYYNPTPRDIIRVIGSDLILANGLGLEAWFERFYTNLGDIPVVVVSKNITPMSIRGGGYDGAPNPHAWMSLDGAHAYIDAIQDALIAHDPNNAAAYRKNAIAYKAEIERVITPYRTRIRALPAHRRWLVTCEGAFSYLARDYGLKELYLWPINAEQTGTPQQIRKVIDAVRDNAVSAVFCESTVNTDPARQVARETGTRFGGILYVDSLSEQSGPVPNYIELLKVTSETIATALSHEPGGGEGD